MDKSYESVERLLLSIFNTHESAILSTDNICEYVHQLDSYVQVGSELIATGSLLKRQIISVMSESDRFVHINKSGDDKWALNLQSTNAVSDGTIYDMINTMLMDEGPMTISHMLVRINRPEFDSRMLMRFFTVHSEEYQATDTGAWWYKGVPEPQAIEYFSLNDAVNYALNELKEAHPQTITQMLCLATVGGERLTESQISYLLTHNPESYLQLRRNVFCVNKRVTYRYGFAQESSESDTTQVEHTEVEFDPFTFFNDHSPIKFAITI